MLLLISINTFAYDFEVDGIYYNIISLPELTCEVTYKDTNYNSYNGEISIPEIVTYQNREIKVVSIGAHAFYDCDKVESISIPNSVTEIGERAFGGCSGLTKITIPNSVTEIGNYAFNNCTNLAELIIEDGKDKLSLRDYVFYYCPLKKLYLGRNIYTPNGYSPFYNQYEKRTLESMVISNSVTRINYHLLYFDNIKHLTFLDGKTEISLGDLNFNIYLSVDSLYLGRNLSEEYSSISVGNLSQLTIGENVDNLTCFNFKDCNQLCTIESKNMIPPTIGEFSNASYLNTSVIIPHGSINSYLTADVWKFFWNISEAGIESTICDDDISLTIKNGNIIIDNIYSPHVEVYNINGQIVYKGNSTIIPVSTNGLYIVKINNKSYKVIL